MLTPYNQTHRHHRQGYLWSQHTWQKKQKWLCWVQLRLVLLLYQSALLATLGQQNKHCKYRTLKWSPHKVVVANMQANICLFHHLLATWWTLYWSPRDGNILLSAAPTLHCVHRLVIKCVCLYFGGEHLAYSLGYLRFFFVKQPKATLW